MFTILEIVGKDKLEKLKENYDEKIRIAHENLTSAQKIRAQIVNEVFSEYLDEEERKKLIKQAKAFSFSKEKLKRIEDAFDDFNEDNINYNIASDIIEARVHIKEHKNESFLTKLSGFIIDEDD